MKNDHRSKFSNLGNWKGFNGIRTRDLRDTGAMLYQLSYEATQWERGQFIGGRGFESRRSLYFFRLLLSNCLNWKIYCDDHSSLCSTTAVQIYELFHIYFTSVHGSHRKLQVSQPTDWYTKVIIFWRIHRGWWMNEWSLEHEAKIRNSLDDKRRIATFVNNLTKKNQKKSLNQLIDTHKCSVIVFRSHKDWRINEWSLD